MDKKAVEAATVGAGFTEKDLPKVLEALEAITTDPAVGTVLRNPTTGDVAVRVHQYAQMYWRVSSKDDRSWVETSLVGWDVLHTGNTDSTDDDVEEVEA